SGADDPTRAAGRERSRGHAVESRDRRERLGGCPPTPGARAVSDDPLTNFIARSLRAEVSDVRSEVVIKNRTVELDRIRFRQEGEYSTVLVRRVLPDDLLAFHLLPFLALNTERVSLVSSLVIRPPASPALPWLLT